MDWDNHNATGYGTAETNKTLNSLYQTFVDTARASGGNNKIRFLVIVPFVAGCNFLNDMEALKIPSNDKKVIVSAHAYTPYDFAINKKSERKTYDQTAKIVLTIFSVI